MVYQCVTFALGETTTFEKYLPNQTTPNAPSATPKTNQTSVQVQSGASTKPKAVSLNGGTIGKKRQADVTLDKRPKTKSKVPLADVSESEEEDINADSQDMEGDKMKQDLKQEEMEEASEDQGLPDENMEEDDEEIVEEGQDDDIEQMSQSGSSSEDEEEGEDSEEFSSQSFAFKRKQQRVFPANIEQARQISARAVGPSANSPQFHAITPILMSLDDNTGIALEESDAADSASRFLDTLESQLLRLQSPLTPSLDNSQTLIPTDFSLTLDPSSDELSKWFDLFLTQPPSEEQATKSAALASLRVDGCKSTTSSIAWSNKNSDYHGRATTGSQAKRICIRLLVWRLAVDTMQIGFQYLDTRSPADDGFISSAKRATLWLLRRRKCLSRFQIHSDTAT